ncbi:NAD(P)-dependent alcohol dehydrogenase [bacterium]|nr:NAD(P)-dependent alcohol dehydrogenase [bacterium]
MKAVKYSKYGSSDGLYLSDVDKPFPKENEVLVEVFASSVNAGDWHLMRGEPFAVRLMYGLFKPKHQVLGSDIAGRVEAVGSHVTRFKPGDEVFGDLSDCGFGAFSEYACASEDAFVFKPANHKFETAAAAPSAATTALQGLRDVGDIKSGQRVLINGASGGVGTFAVQIARASGAEVTGVCSTGNMELVSSIGATHVIDYRKEDITRTLKKYDLILDTAAFRPFSDYKRILTETGTYVLVGGAGSRFLQLSLFGPLASSKGGKRFRTIIKKPKQSDLVYVKDLLESGKITSVIDRQYDFTDTAAAVRYVEEGHARGKVVLSIRSADKEALKLAVNG